MNEEKKIKEIEEMAEIISLMDERNAHYYDKHMQECEAFADSENISKALHNAGYRKENDIAEEIFADIEKSAEVALLNGDIEKSHIFISYDTFLKLKNKYRKEKENVN